MKNNDQIMWIASNHNGLCNRLKCILSLMSFSNNVRVYWENSPERLCAGSFSDFFENPIEIDQIEDNYKYIYDGFAWALSPEKVFNSKNKIDFLFDKTPEIDKNKIKEAIKKIVIREDLLKKADQFFMPEKCISVSVRTWIDSCNCQQDIDRSMAFNIGKYFDVLDTYPDYYFFVTSDSSIGIKLIQKRYGKRTLFREREDRINSRKTLSGMQDILVDFILSSKNRVVVGSKKSTYAELIWWFGIQKEKMITIDC